MTDRLSAADAAFLYAEDVGAPMHVGGVMILDVEGEVDFAALLELVSTRLSLVPRYRQKVRLVPGRLARPVWVDDEKFDLNYHVRRSALPRPGTAAELDELIGRLLSRPLDRSRPLWEMYVVEGLEGGRVALVNKTHCALVDRMGAVDVAAAILDGSARPRRLPEEPWMPAPSPSDADLLVDAVADLAGKPTELVELVRMAAVDAGSTLVRATRMAAEFAGLMRSTVRAGPEPVLTAARNGQRRFLTAQLDLAPVRAIRAAHGGSVNDVVLTVLTGALRSWLLSRGAAVTARTVLRALVPMSVRADRRLRDGVQSDGDPDAVVSYLVELPVAEPNPVMRLHQVSFAMDAHLAGGRQISADALLRLGRFAPPTLHALGARVAGQLSSRAYDVLITNAPGPQDQLYAAGWPVRAMFPVAPLGRGHAIAVACTSYLGRIYFGLTADREAVPELADFAEHIEEALDELLGDSQASTETSRPGGTGP